MNEADRGPQYSAKSSMVHEKNLDAACMAEINGEKEQVYPSRTTPAQLLCEWLNIFVGRADFDFFVSFFDTASCLSARRHAARASSVCLRCRALIGAYLLCCFCGLTARCCACGKVALRSRYLMMLDDNMLA